MQCQRAEIKQVIIEWPILTFGLVGWLVCRTNSWSLFGKEILRAVPAEITIVTIQRPILQFWLDGCFVDWSVGAVPGLYLIRVPAKISEVTIQCHILQFWSDG